MAHHALQGLLLCASVLVPCLSDAGRDEKRALELELDTDRCQLPMGAGNQIPVPAKATGALKF